MNCAYHAEINAESFCSTCGKGLCAACRHQIQNEVYCQECLIEGAETVKKIHNRKAFVPNPTKAALCAIVPGLGQVYNGKYNRALKQFAIFITLAWIADEHHGAFQMMSFCFYIFMIFDAYRTAQHLQIQNVTGEAAAEENFSFLEEKQTPYWGIALILLGVVFLLNNLGLIDEDFIRHVWPFGLILAGVYLIFRFLAKKKPNGSGKSEALPEDDLSSQR